MRRWRDSCVSIVLKQHNEALLVYNCDRKFVHVLVEERQDACVQRLHVETATQAMEDGSTGSPLFSLPLLWGEEPGVSWATVLRSVAVMSTSRGLSQ